MVAPVQMIIRVHHGHLLCDGFHVSRVPDQANVSMQYPGIEPLSVARVPAIICHYVFPLPTCQQVSSTATMDNYIYIYYIGKKEITAT